MKLVIGLVLDRELTVRSLYCYNNTSYYSTNLAAAAKRIEYTIIITAAVRQIKVTDSIAMR